MKIGRRMFLGQAASFAGFSMLGGCATIASKIAGDPNARFGILSDVHITTPESTAIFEKALLWFRDRKVDGVIIAGDIADRGLVSELQLFADTWFKVFPNDKGIDGRHVERCFVYGNHDVEGYKYGLYKTKEAQEEHKAEFINTDRAGTWKKIFNEEYAPFTLKMVKGYPVIGGHWGSSWKGLDGLEKFLEENKDKLDPSRPFFYHQHPHPLNTCMGPWAWGRDNGASTKALSAFPNAVAFSGHSHYSLTDERSVWQESFTSINTSSLRYICMPEGRENADINSNADYVQMHKETEVGKGHQGMLMSVYDDYIQIKRHEFLFDEDLGFDWVFPFVATSKENYSFATREKEDVAPVFAADAKIALEKIPEGETRSKKRKLPQIKVSFPVANVGSEKSTILDYEVKAVVREFDWENTFCTKRVYEPKFFLGPQKRGNVVTCVFSEEELPHGDRFHFEVRALTCFGKRSEKLESGKMKFANVGGKIELKIV